MKSREITWQKRMLFIGGVLIVSFVTVFAMRSFDGPTSDPLAEVVMPTDEQAWDDTVQMFATASEQMQRGDYQGAVDIYEGYMHRLDEIPPAQLSSYFGDLGLAHLYQGQTYQAAGETERARTHFERAAFMFEQAASTASHGMLEAVANYYQLISFYHADDYDRTRNVGELFLSQGPEVAVAAELLPAGATAIVKEILSVSYFHLAEGEPENQALANTLRERGIRYAEEAILEAPGRVIQPYFYTGIAAWERGDAQLAEERLQSFLDMMHQIPQAAWDGDDRASVDEAQLIVDSLRSRRASL